MGNLILLILNVPLARVWIAILRVPFYYLMAAILAFMFLGTYSINGSAFDILVMLGAGVIGYLFNLVRVPLTPLVLALILGPMLEENFQRSLALSRGDYAIFTSSALSITLVGVCALALVFGAVRPRSPRFSRPGRAARCRPTTPSRRSHPPNRSHRRRQWK